MTDGRTWNTFASGRNTSASQGAQNLEVGYFSRTYCIPKKAKNQCQVIYSVSLRRIDPLQYIVGKKCLINNRISTKESSELFPVLATSDLEN